jgi:eukaryotic-like serine/threonine-protein kinase
MSASEESPVEPVGGHHTHQEQPPADAPDATRFEQPPAEASTPFDLPPASRPPEITRFPPSRPGPDATSSTPAAGPRARTSDRDLPRQFGDYELQEELGRGGMGIVYQGRHLPTGRVVALKMISTGALASPQAVKRFRTEAQATMRLDHPHIVPVYEIGDVAGQHYFTMQFLPGGSLQQRLQQGPLPFAQAAAVVQGLAEAVQHAHRRGVIHRDIKPANVLLVEPEVVGRLSPTTVGVGSTDPVVAVAPASAESLSPKPAASPGGSGQDPGPGHPETPVVKLTDFGLARLLEGGSGLTATGEQMGTPSYMPPEQAAGRVHDIGPWSDVYSLGALLYCLVTGCPPFQAATPLETMRLVLEQEPVPVRHLARSCPRDLETVCHRCLEKDTGRRYPTAAELAEELARFRRGEPVVSRPVGRLERAWRWCKRNPAVACTWGPGSRPCALCGSGC